jgi:hypothetical protein
VTNYLRFTSADQVVFFEIEDVNGDSVPIEKAGARSRVFGEVADAVADLRDAVGDAARSSVQTLVSVVDAAAPAGAEVEITFGLKASGELAAFAVAKTAGEASFQVRVGWRTPA